nr:MAG TPA: hypothetical protein [Caudoviricetes sp.]
MNISDGDYFRLKMVDWVISSHLNRRTRHGATYSDIDRHR